MNLNVSLTLLALLLHFRFFFLSRVNLLPPEHTDDMARLLH